MGSDIIHVEENDPTRCQAITPNGQCRLKSLDTLKYCSMHCGKDALDKLRVSKIRDYRLNQLTAEYGDFSADTSIKDLRREIALLRTLLESRINSAGPELFAHTQVIINLIKEIRATVTEAHKLEVALGKYLDRDEFRAFSIDMVGLISNYITDEERVAAFAEELKILIGKYRHAGSIQSN